MSRTRPDNPPAIRIEAENEWAWCGARRLDLAPRAFAVLRHLVEHQGRLITKEELLTTVWRDAIVSDAALASGIRDLRRALGDSSAAPRYIQTVHRRGFRFIGPVNRRRRSPPRRRPRPAGRARGPTTPPPPRHRCGLDPGGPGGRSWPACTRGWRARSSGQRQLVFVTGEPGIGKTALVEMFLAGVGANERAAHRLRAMRGAVRRRGSVSAGSGSAGAIGASGRRREAGRDPQAARPDLAGAASGVAERPRRGGGAAPGAGGHARAGCCASWWRPWRP